MLINYICIENEFKKLHAFFEHTVLEVWCKPNGPFNISMLHEDFQPIVKKMKGRLESPIKEIYNICLSLGQHSLQQISDAYKINNNIQDICKRVVEPITYEDIRSIHPNLSIKLKKFCESLYDYVAQKATFCKTYCSINDYYKYFIISNNQTKGKCPFCGLNAIKSEKLSFRDAFDHYFPKSKFPFNSVNLNNIAPACHECNSDCKKDRIPIRDKKGNPTKAFYPYSEFAPNFKINLDIQYLDPIDPKKNSVQINFQSDYSQEEVDRWRALYFIDIRYKDKCCSEDAKYWLEQIHGEAKNYGEDIEEALNNQIQDRKQNPLNDFNFLRAPFLEAYRRYRNQT